MQARYLGPFTLLLNNTKFHVFQESSTVDYVLSHSRTFTFDPVLASMMENGLSLPTEDLSRFLPPADSKAEDLSKSRSFMTMNHNIWSKYLSGEPLDKIMAIYTRNFNSILEQHLDLKSSKWQDVDLHELITRLIFETSVLTFFGSRIKEIWGDSIWDDWKLYDEAMYIGVRTKLPFKLQPRVHFAFNRMMSAFQQWIASGSIEWPETDVVRNDEWGVRLNWERDRLAVAHGFSLRGRACLQASFLYVMLTNAPPLATWFAFCAAHTQESLDRYRAAATAYIRPPMDSGELSLDIAGMKNDPYIQGLWKEALRLGMANAVARVVTKDAKLEGFEIRQGSVLLMPVELMHMDERTFPSPQEMKPERWMIDDENTLSMQNKRLRAFGGGKSLCSGRFVAEHEVIGVVSQLLLRFDVEFDERSRKWQFNPRSHGAMKPKHAVRCRMRPRQI